jgi:hypothetical protein
LAHAANIYAVQSLARQISLHTNLSYIGASGVARSATTHAVYGSAGLDVAAKNNLVLSVSYSLVSQTLANISLSGSNVHRSVITAGMSYYMPSVRSEKNR